MTVLSEILPGLALTLATALVIFGLIYYPTQRSRPDFLFSYLVFSVLAYVVSSLLRDVQLTLGFSFGLLAVFTILRYRTEQIPVREMTYLYVSITLPFINALFVATRVTFTELLLIDAGIAGFLFILEKVIWSHYEVAKQITYERIELIKPENYAELLEDLRARTGLPIKHCVVDEIDFLRDTARLTVYFDNRLPKRKSQ